VILILSSNVLQMMLIRYETVKNIFSSFMAHINELGVSQSRIRNKDNNMKHFLVISFVLASGFLVGQDKYNYVHFNKLVEVEGTEYVIATIENRGKMLEINEKYLLFINTTNGETRQVDFHKEAFIGELKQVKIDRLKINLIVLSARTIDLNEKKGIDWEDPTQIIVLSADGKEKTQLTENSFFVRTWTVNKETGRIVVTGHYDANNNKKYDKTDKNEILIYDLRTLNLITGI
jgi:hypothetical protein